MENHVACPADKATTENGFSTVFDTLEGPVPSTGGTVTGLEATIETAPGAGKKDVVEVRDNTKPETLLTCEITGTATSCKNTGTKAVTVGDYMEVRITTSEKNTAWRVSFRY
jgi:hypothetical protein